MDQHYRDGRDAPPYTLLSWLHADQARYYHGDVEGHHPVSAPRHCTDFPVLAVFLLLLACWGCTLSYGFKHGDWRRLQHMPNHEGDLCGMDGRGQYIFFCRDDSWNGTNATDTDDVASSTSLLSSTEELELMDGIMETTSGAPLTMRLTQDLQGQMGGRRLEEAARNNTGLFRDSENEDNGNTTMVASLFSGSGDTSLFGHASSNNDKGNTGPAVLLPNVETLSGSPHPMEMLPNLTADAASGVPGEVVTASTTIGATDIPGRVFNVSNFSTSETWPPVSGDEDTSTTREGSLFSDVQAVALSMHNATTAHLQRAGDLAKNSSLHVKRLGSTVGEMAMNTSGELVGHATRLGGLAVNVSAPHVTKANDHVSNVVQNASSHLGSMVRNATPHLINATGAVGSHVANATKGLGEFLGGMLGGINGTEGENVSNTTGWEKVGQHVAHHSRRIGHHLKRAMPDLDYEHQICVDACPQDRNTTMRCHLESTQSYSSTPVGGLICMPVEAEVLLGSRTFFGTDTYLMKIERLDSLEKAWLLLSIGAVISVFFAFVYLFFIYEFAYWLMWLGLSALVLGPMAIGGYLIYSSMTGGLDQINASGDERRDFIIGFVLIVIGLIFLCVSCHKGRQIKTAATCIGFACKAITEMPTLLVEPWIGTFCKTGLIVVLALGFLQLVSCGHVSSDLTQSEIFQFTDGEYILMTFYIFMAVWLIEITNAFSQFVVAYTVEAWFFVHQHAEHAPGICHLWHAVIIAFQYHLGTLVLGSLAIGFTRPIRALLQILTHGAQQPHGCCARVCGCCVQCFYRFFVYVNKNAYMDTAMNSTGFYEAATHAFMVIHHQATNVALLNGGTWIFQLAGLGGISAGCAGTVWLMATKVPFFHENSSEHYVEDPIAVAAASAVFCGILCLPFMHVFDTASDTVLYCIAYEELRKPDETEEKPSCWNACWGGPSRTNGEGKPFIQKRRSALSGSTFASNGDAFATRRYTNGSSFDASFTR